MKTDASPSSSRYRNDAVFRSAERLLASTPRKPARTGPPRNIVFVAGLLGALAIAFWTLRHTPNNSPDLKSPTAASRVTPPKSIPSFSVRRGGQESVAVPTAQPTVPDAIAGEQRTGPFETTTSAASTVRSITPLRPSPKAGASDTTAAPPPIVITGLIMRANLSGHLLSVSGEKVTAVEFALNLSPIGSDKPVHGLVRFIDQPEHPDERHVSGNWRDRTLTLQQADAPTSSGLRPYGRRTFTLEFPTSAGPITGRWSHQTSIGTIEGTLSLVVTLPE